MLSNMIGTRSGLATYKLLCIKAASNQEYSNARQFADAEVNTLLVRSALATLMSHENKQGTGLFAKRTICDCRLVQRTDVVSHRHHDWLCWLVRTLSSCHRRVHWCIVAVVFAISHRRRRVELKLFSHGRHARRVSDFVIVVRVNLDRGRARSCATVSAKAAVCAVGGRAVGRRSGCRGKGARCAAALVAFVTFVALIAFVACNTRSVKQTWLREVCMSKPVTLQQSQCA